MPATTNSDPIIRFSFRKSSRIARARRVKGKDGSWQDVITFFLWNIHTWGNWWEAFEEQVLRTVIVAEAHERLHPLVWNELGRGWFFSEDGRSRSTASIERREKAFYKFSYALDAMIDVLGFGVLYG